ncbi:MAG: hypothetical protein IJ400_07330 [Clostridia bacterium]|nr:hypothetical protein [Clostridia bacterium]
MKIQKIKEIVVLFLAICMLVTLLGCNTSNPPEEETQTQTDTDIGIQAPPLSTDTETPPVEENTTIEELLAEHLEDANHFASQQIEKISYIKDAISTSYAYIGEEDTIEQILVANVVKTGDTERELKVATIEFLTSVDIDDILDGNIEVVQITIESESIMTFDAKEEYKKTDSSIETEISNAIKENLGDSAVEISPYQAEDFAPKTVADLVADYPEKVNEVLNATCFDTIIKECVAVNYDKNNIEEAKWILEGDDKITGAGLFLKYKIDDDESSYRYGTIDFANNISLEDFLKAENIKISTAQVDYFFSYFTDVQNTRNDLVNAIFEANGMSKECPEGAVRLFVDEGYFIDSTELGGIGETNKFKVAEITKTGIKQFRILIKYSTSDQEYINNLHNSSNYRVSEYENKEIEFGGYMVDCVLADNS